MRSDLRSDWTCSLLALMAGLVPLAVIAQTELPHVNWESHPVNGLDQSPNGALLAVAHTADHRIQFYATRFGTVIPAGHLRVGLDPVSVRFRTDDELWAVNHLSDSVSVVSVSQRRVTATISTCDEPSDVVFAAGRAWISCSQANEIISVSVDDPMGAVERIAIAAEEPKALAVSADGSRVYAAIFESGNGSTILGGGIDVDEPDTLAFPPNVVSAANSPYGGQNPPPNNGQQFDPPLNLALPEPPRVGLIVRKDDLGAWRDDNGQDWTALVSGPFAAASGRISGWDLPDRDIAVIDTATGEVSYIRRLMTMGMDLALHPVTGQVTLVGTDSHNERRFEPVINGVFSTVLMATASGTGAEASIVDINRYGVDFTQRPVSQAQRDRAIGDPRDIVWSPDGGHAYIAGMGSNNVVVVDEAGERVTTDGLPSEIEVGEGPTDLILDVGRNRLYVWNHFEASLSVVDTQTRLEVDRVAAFNPLPMAIRDGRRFLYDTHLTSGTGFVSCASCHVDGRFDRLAWDLGDPSGEMKAFNQNCTTDLAGDLCEDYHPMKGPMSTQTMIDIIGKEPLHWRGDRDGIEEFNGAFRSLLADDQLLTDSQMQQFKRYLATLTVPPNPHRPLDNSLPQDLDLTGHFTTGRFAPAGQPLGRGDALRGLTLYNTALLDAPFQCSNCHTLPTGMAVNGPIRLPVLGTIVGGQIMPPGPLGENHLGVVSVDGSTNKSIKVPQLRNMHEKVGFELTQRENTAGFGFLHDGSVDSLARFVAEPAFNVSSDQDVADLVALMLSFSGSDFPQDNPVLGNSAPLSQDTHAAVGAQLQLDGSTPPFRYTEIQQLAEDGAVDLIAQQAALSWQFDRSTGQFTPGMGTSLSGDALNDRASPSEPVVMTVVPAGLGHRLAIDRDGDGLSDADELQQGSNPADAASNGIEPVAGLWFNPERSGHGLDIERAGEALIVTWYTYNDDGSPTWYQAAGAYDPQWTQPLYTATWDPQTQSAVVEFVGSMSLEFSAARQAQFSWVINGVAGSEAFQYFNFREGLTTQDHTGIWYDPNQPGWGLSINSQGADVGADVVSTRVAVLYFYDANNQPRWLLGQSDNSVSGELPLLSFTGFCPSCEYVAPSSVAAGALQFDFSSLASARFSSSGHYPEVENSSWIREDIQIIPLGSLYRDPAGF